jgi:hypothetical protein
VRLCNQVLRTSRFAANVVAILELGRDIRSSKVLSLALKYWLKIMQMGILKKILGSLGIVQIPFV